MKKSMIVFIIGVIAIGCSERKNSLDDFGLKDAVVKVHEEHFEVIEKSGKYMPGDKMNWNSIKVFDEYKNLNAIRYYDNEGDFDGIANFTYDENHFLIGINYFDRKDKLGYKHKYENNQNGSPLTVTYYNHSNEISSTMTLNYSLGKLEYGESIDKAGIKQIWKNEYKGDLLVRQIIFDGSKNIAQTVKYEYDGNDFMIKHSIYNSNDSLTSETIYNYPELDEKKNWTQRVTFEDKNPTSITIRKVIYKQDVFFDSKSIEGIWTESDSNSWIEFKDGGQYHSGYREAIHDIGKWELNAKNKTLTFESNTPSMSKKYTYEFDGEFLILYTLSGKEEERYQRR